MSVTKNVRKYYTSRQTYAGLSDGADWPNIFNKIYFIKNCWIRKRYRTFLLGLTRSTYSQKVCRSSPVTLYRGIF